MSEIPYVLTYGCHSPKGDIMIVTWPAMANGDTGQPLHIPHTADKTVQVLGTFGAGGTAVIKGSNHLKTEVQTYATLHKVDLSALSYTVAGIDVIIENPNLIRPEVTGDGTTSLDVIICLK